MNNRYPLIPRREVSDKAMLAWPLLAKKSSAARDAHCDFDHDN